MCWGGGGGGGAVKTDLLRGVMGTGSGKPLRWMLRLSRHTGREHHSRRGERRKCLMFNQDSVPCPSHSLSPVLPRPHPLWRGSRRQEVLHLAPTRGKAAGGGGRRRTRARCGNLFLTTRSSAATLGFPPAQPAHNLGWWPHRATLTALSCHLPPQLRWPSLASTTNGETSSQYISLLSPCPLFKIIFFNSL